MAINIGENNDKEVTYTNPPEINRVLFKNLSEGASADEIADAVNAWIEEHPEAITTVQDGSILPVKLDSTNEPSDGYVLSWNATAGKFEWIDIQGDIAELREDLSDKADKTEALGSYVVNTASGSIASFPDGADGVPVKDLVVQIVPVQSGSGDPSPDNVRPISGWTGANLVRTGKNLYCGTNATDFTIIYGGKNNATTVIAEDYTFKPGTYRVSFELEGTSNPSMFYSTKVNGVWSNPVNKGQVTTFTFTVPENCEHLEIWAYGGSFTALNNVQIELGSATATAYEPSNGETVNITFPIGAGIVYAGTLDVTTGVLSVDRAEVTLDGTEGWVMYVDGKFLVNNVTNNARKFSLAEQPLNITNKYLFAGNGDTQSSAITNDKRVYGQLSYNRIWVYDSDFETLESFTASLAETPLQVVYLITPQTYQLTPQEVNTILGLNNIWADCGVTIVDYRADTKLYIENLTAPSEDDMVANTTIPDATYFMLGNTLFLSTTTIPAGDTINPGTNCTKMSLAEALNAVNS